MANYAVTDKKIRGKPDVALAAVETYMETIDDTKVFHLITAVGDSNYVTFYLIHDA